MNSLDISRVTRKKAFLGFLTARIRNKAGTLAEESAGRVLDVGCGNGLLLAALSSGSITKLFGADWSMELLREAQQIFSDNSISRIGLVRADMYGLPFKAHAFDIVLLLNTLLNIPTRDRAIHLLQELMTLCEPKGRIIFDIRNRENPYIRLKYWWHQRKKTFPTHTYDLEDIRLLLKQEGFVITRTIPIGIPLRYAAFAYLIEAQRYE